MRRATALAAVVFALVFCVNAAADVPEIMSYQGVLRDGSGNPVPDGSYNVTFRLYDVETGGTALWSEGQPLTATGGIINAYLGSVVPLNTLEFDVPYWLAIAIEYGPELTPRTPLTTAPYAGHAAFADRCDEADEDWEINGDDIHHDVGNVGIGLYPTDARLDVGTAVGIAGDFSNNASGSQFTVRVANGGGTAGGFFANQNPTSYPSTPVAVYGSGAYGAGGGFFYSSNGVGVRAATFSGIAGLEASHSGTGYSARFLGGSGISVQGEVETDGFRMDTGAGSGYVLTSDISGVGTWQPASGGADGDWTITGSDMHSTVPGFVGIGVTLPTAKLEVYNATSEEALEVKHGGASTSRVVNIERVSMPSVGNDALQIVIPSGSPDGCQLIEAERGGVPVFYVMGNGRVIGTAGAYLTDDLEVHNGQLLVDYDGDHVAEFTTVDAVSGYHVVHAECMDTGLDADGVAVYGKYEQNNDYGYGGEFFGGYIGVKGEASVASGSMGHIGVYGRATNGGMFNYAVYGTSYGPASYAGYFSGDVEVNGVLSATTKYFKVDHPLDPANKYLVHACVESDEMVNVYSGNVVLDSGGKARVELPDWFEAVNKDFRYQLTAVGAPGPNLFIAEKISDGGFVISGGDPGMEVSWQVTGVRHDPFAEANRMVVEQDKPPHEIGKYRHPELYGRSETEAVHYLGDRAVTTSGGLSERRPVEAFDPDDGE